MVWIVFIPHLVGDFSEPRKDSETEIGLSDEDVVVVALWGRYSDTVWRFGNPILSDER